MCLIRLKNVQTDLVVSLSSGVLINPGSSSAQQTQHTQTWEENKALFKDILATLNIHDWTLFG